MFRSRSELFLSNVKEYVESETKNHSCDAGLSMNGDGDSGNDRHVNDLQGHSTLKDRGQSRINVSYEIRIFVAAKEIMQENRASVWVWHELDTNKGSGNSVVLQTAHWYKSKDHEV